MSARQPAINLLPKTEFEASFWGKFLKWSLTAGRYIIILTEMVVILAFLSRFKLDKDFQDLNDSISGKKNILEATYQIELDFRGVQNRLAEVKKLLALTPSATALLDALSTEVPAGIAFQSVTMTLTDRSVAIEASADSEQAFGQYVNSLTNHKIWTESSIGNIAADAQNGVKFSMKLSY